MRDSISLKSSRVRLRSRAPSPRLLAISVKRSKNLLSRGSKRTMLVGLSWAGFCRFKTTLTNQELSLAASYEVKRTSADTGDYEAARISKERVRRNKRLS